MESALLVLVLAAGDPASGAAAKAVAEALHVQRSEARLVLPPDSMAMLKERGIADADLLHRSDKPLAATAKELGLVVVRVERRESGADHVVDVDLWAGGRREGTTAVAGTDGDPVPAAVEGACRLLRDAALDPAVVADRADLALIASFANRGDWAGLVAAVGQREAPSPRLRHAAIMARLRLGDRAGAGGELARLQAQAPADPLTADAASAVAADPVDSNALRDPAPVDDGGNVLH